MCQPLSFVTTGDEMFQGRGRGMDITPNDCWFAPFQRRTMVQKFADMSS